MHNLSKAWNSSFTVLLVASIAIVWACQHKTTSEHGKTYLKKGPIPSNLKVDTFDVLSANKIALTEQYVLQNYGYAKHRLDTPQMIVVHYTAIPTLTETLAYFKPDSLEHSRKNIIKNSSLNVGIHYVVDRDGSIYSLLPDSIIARHLIGFNHVALGIENVARDASQLTEQQLKSNTELIHWLSQKHPSIKFLIGHSEYNNKSLPHYRLIRLNDPNYTPYPKPDPGHTFMKNLRTQLKSDYDLVFEK